MISKIDDYLLNKGFKKIVRKNEPDGYFYDYKVIFIVDFHKKNARVTLVKMIDIYQVMVYSGRETDAVIYETTENSEEKIIEFLKGIL